ncbi:MAG: XRE family transcriptional regulator [Deltaproteobacteria bacterium]|jgi:Zn-dependent peptidase ImmA (M78 family)/DNA-binding XRE family transcriptional regulator|nr:XRE family transcriptional regulator [Deltaproteobacteria bacterium]
MSIVRAPVSPNILVWGRERLSFSAETVANLIGIPIEKYQEWEKGTALPTTAQAEKFAKAVKIPFAWLFLDVPPKNPKLPQNTDYRTLRNQPLGEISIKLRYLIDEAVMRRDVMIELYTEQEIEFPHFREFIDISAYDDIYIAEKLRQILGLTIDNQIKFKDSGEAFNYYRDYLSTIGFLVFQTGDLSTEEIRGMSIYDDIFPIIVVNRKDEYNARIFSLIHELVHIVTRTPGICDNFTMLSYNEIEQKCNKIAAEVLVPVKNLILDSNWNLINEYSCNEICIKKLAKKFTVSREVIIGRLLTTGKINRDLYIKKLSEYTKEYEIIKEKSKKSGFMPPTADICSQVGKLYARTVLNAYNQEIITARDASLFLSKLRIHHFSKVEDWCFS